VVGVVFGGGVFVGGLATSSSAEKEGGGECELPRNVKRPIAWSEGLCMVSIIL